MANNESSGSGGGGGGGNEPKKKGQGINDMILSGMKSRSGRETSKWINNLTTEGMAEIEEAAKANSAPQTGLPAQFAHPSIAQTQVKWVDRLFDILQQYEVEFNRAIQIPDLRVETQRAVITPDLIQRLQSNDQYHYSGRLHTRFWTLAIRGNLSHIEAFIIPSDHYIGFENNVQNYTRFFEFIPMWDGELRWSFERGSIGYGQLPSMAKLIFGHLIKVAKGDIDSQEPFSYGLSAPALPPKPMGGPTMLSQGPPSPSDYLLSHSGVFDDEQPIQGATSAQAGSTSNRNLQAVSSTTASQMSDASKASAPTQTASAGDSSSEKSSSAASKTDLSGDVDIATACTILGKALDRELEMLSKSGAKAFEDHDFVEVEKLMKKTAKLKSMRDQMLSTINDWRKMLSDEGN